jgi:hypothetical protein
MPTPARSSATRATRHSRSRACGAGFTRNKRVGNAPADWRELKDGIHELHGTEDGQAFAYKLAVRRTPTHAFFLAYDMTQTLQGQGQQNARCWWRGRAVHAVGAGGRLVVGVAGDGAGDRPGAALAPVRHAVRNRKRWRRTSPRTKWASWRKRAGRLRRRLTEVVQARPRVQRRRQPRIAHAAGGDPRRGRADVVQAGHRRENARAPAAHPARGAAMHGPDQRAAAALAQRARGGPRCRQGGAAIARRHRAQLGGKPIQLRMEGAPDRLLSMRRNRRSRWPWQPDRQRGEVHAGAGDGRGAASPRGGSGRHRPRPQRGRRRAPVRARLPRHARRPFAGRRDRPVDRAPPVRAVRLGCAGASGRDTGVVATLRFG